MRRETRSARKAIALGMFSAAALAFAHPAAAQDLNPSGNWKVSFFEGCDGALNIADSSATLSINCTYEGKPTSVNEVFNRRDLQSGQFQFDIVADKSSVSNYDMDSKLVLKMSGPCAGSVDIYDSQNGSTTFNASRTGPGC